MASIANGIAEADALQPQSSVSLADPCAIVIFGASGDLTRRKLIPALFELANCGSLASRFAIVGFARSPMSDAAFQDSAAERHTQRQRELQSKRREPSRLRAILRLRRR